MESSNNDLVKEIIFKLNNTIDEAPNSRAYGFIIDNNRFNPTIIETESVECIVSYYENKGFEVMFYNDQINKVQKFKLKRK